MEYAEQLAATKAGQAIIAKGHAINVQQLPDGAARSDDGAVIETVGFKITAGGVTSMCEIDKRLVGMTIGGVHACLHEMDHMLEAMRTQLA